MLHIIDSALRHGFTEAELRKVWETVPEDSVARVRSDRLPPHYMMLGLTEHGQTVELIAYTDGIDWYLFHAMTPPTPKFKIEYRRNGGRI